MIERLVDILADVSIPGKYLVEAFPAMEHLPSWLPGTGFKRLAETVKSEAESILARLHATSISASAASKVSSYQLPLIVRPVKSIFS